MKKNLIIICFVFSNLLSFGQNSFNVNATQCLNNCLSCGNILTLDVSIPIDDDFSNFEYRIYQINSGGSTLILSSSSGNFSIAAQSISVCQSPVLDSLRSGLNFFLEIYDIQTTNFIRSSPFTISYPILPTTSVLRGYKPRNPSDLIRLPAVTQNDHKLTFCTQEKIVLDLGLNQDLIGCVYVVVTPRNANNTLEISQKAVAYYYFDTNIFNHPTLYRLELDTEAALMQAFRYNQNRNRTTPNRYLIELFYQNCNELITSFEISRGVIYCEKAPSINNSIIGPK